MKKDRKIRELSEKLLMFHNRNQLRKVEDNIKKHCKNVITSSGERWMIRGLIEITKVDNPGMFSIPELKRAVEAVFIAYSLDVITYKEALDILKVK